MQLSSSGQWGPSSAAPVQTVRGPHPDDECACPPEGVAMLTSYMYMLLVHACITLYCISIEQYIFSIGTRIYMYVHVYLTCTLFVKRSRNDVRTNVC